MLSQEEMNKKFKLEAQLVCSRGACQTPLSERHGYYKIWNEPSTEKGYREYCVKCGRGIMEFNLSCPPKEHMKHEIVRADKRTPTNFCPDHRDKVSSLSCRQCAVELLSKSIDIAINVLDPDMRRDEIVELRERLIRRRSEISKS